MLYLNFLSGKLTDACSLSVAIPMTPALLLTLSASAVFPLAEGRIPREWRCQQPEELCIPSPATAAPLCSREGPLVEHCPALYCLCEQV